MKRIRLKGNKLVIVILVSLMFTNLFGSTNYFVNAELSSVEESEKGYIKNSGFETNFWEDKTWQVETENWDLLDIQRFSYSNDEYIEADEGNFALKFWVKDSASEKQSFTLSQTIEEIPEGYYELSVRIMGGTGIEAGEVTLFAGNNKLNAVTTAGYNQWKTIKLIFELKEDINSFQVGAIIAGRPNAW